MVWVGVLHKMTEPERTASRIAAVVEEALAKAGYQVEPVRHLDYPVPGLLVHVDGGRVVVVAVSFPVDHHGEPVSYWERPGG